MITGFALGVFSGQLLVSVQRLQNGWMGSYNAGAAPVREINVCCHFAEFDGRVGCGVTQAYYNHVLSTEVIWTVRLSAKTGRAL